MEKCVNLHENASSMMAIFGTMIGHFIWPVAMETENVDFFIQNHENCHFLQASERQHRVN